jgi:uncharacterized protein
MKPSPQPRLSAFWIFVLTTFGISWLAWLPVLLSRQQAMAFPNALWFVIGGCGPSLAGIFWTWRRDGRDGLRDLLARAVRLRFSAGYYAALILIWPLLFAASAFLATASGAPPPNLGMLGAIQANPLTLVGLILTTLVAGPLSEEFGWRGFGLDILLRRLGPVFGSVLLGLVWGVWHLPLFFMLGTSQSQLPFGIFCLNTIALSIVFTWLYRSTGRSLGAAILLHFMFNLSFAFVPLNARALLFLVVLQIPIALPQAIGWLAEPRPAE